MKMPLLIPYLYPKTYTDNAGKTKTNNLKEWLFINAKGQQARHSIQAFHDI
jgi:hypothetical protein